MYFDNSSPIFTPCSKGCYIEKLKSADAENALLIHIENGIPYLRADIEYGGEIHPRIEPGSGRIRFLRKDIRSQQ